MANVVETVPEELRPEVDAALAWLNAERGADYRVSGVVDPETTIAARAAGSDDYELGLVLCQEELCLREQLGVRPVADGFELSLVEAPPIAGRADRGWDPPAELDPAPGARSGWFEQKLAQHEFIVVLFYRGFW